MSDISAAVAAHLTAHFAHEPQRASVTFLGLEPMEVMRFGVDHEIVYASCGCSSHPMTDPGDLTADPVRGPRAEVVIRMHANTTLPGLHRSLAVIAATPAVEGMVLAADALLDLSEPLWTGSSCTAVVLEDDVIPELAQDEPLSPVTFFQAVPITANEAAWVRLRGVAALRQAWSEAGIDVRDPNRSAAQPL